MPKKETKTSQYNSITTAAYDILSRKVNSAKKIEIYLNLIANTIDYKAEAKLLNKQWTGSMIRAGFYKNSDGKQSHFTEEILRDRVNAISKIYHGRTFQFCCGTDNLEQAKKLFPIIRREREEESQTFHSSGPININIEEIFLIDLEPFTYEVTLPNFLKRGFLFAKLTKSQQIIEWIKQINPTINEESIDWGKYGYEHILIYAGKAQDFRLIDQVLTKDLATVMASCNFPRVMINLLDEEDKRAFKYIREYLDNTPFKEITRKRLFTIREDFNLLKIAVSRGEKFFDYVYSQMLEVNRDFISDEKSEMPAVLNAALMTEDIKILDKVLAVAPVLLEKSMEVSLTEVISEHYLFTLLGKPLEIESLTVTGAYHILDRISVERLESIKVSIIDNITSSKARDICPWYDVEPEQIFEQKLKELVENDLETYIKERMQRETEEKIRIQPVCKLQLFYFDAKEKELHFPSTSTRKENPYKASIFTKPQIISDSESSESELEEKEERSCNTINRPLNI